MSGTPNVCVDIFNQMSTLISNFQANAINNGGNSFTAEGGFSTGNTPNSPNGATFEQNLNDMASWLMIGMMTLFLVYT